MDSYNDFKLRRDIECSVCGVGVSDGYGECEVCGVFTCADHNDLVSGVCPVCLGFQGLRMAS